MQAKKRYLLAFLSCAFLAYCYFGGYRLKSERAAPAYYESLPSYIGVEDQLYDRDLEASPRHRRTEPSVKAEGGSGTPACRMETCFDFSKCENDFRVYVYPIYEDPDSGTVLTPSPLYQKVLNVIQESRYYTSDPSQACLFVLGIDTLDRDSLSTDYVRNVPARLQKLRLWNDGLNHVIFNLYSGTWPDYLEDNLGFDPGKAILAKASVSLTHLRPGFDVSIPLFHKNHPERGGESGYVTTNNFPVTKKYLLAFKGKRYVYGIGSETRNLLYHLHNEKDIVLVTTCRHGKSWKELKDDRCEKDNTEYDRYDYEVLLQNSTFCLVPRGRRLGSFRFLEALRAGCVPVLLSNGWALPFAQVIDWHQAVVWADERLLLQVPDIVRSVPATKVLALRQQTQVLWERYFSSIEKIVFTTLEIIRERLPRQPSREGFAWNWSPGALVALPGFSDSWRRYPFHLPRLGARPGASFTAVVYSQLGAAALASSAAPLHRLLRNVARSAHVARIVVVWAHERAPPGRSRWPALGHVPLTVLSQPQGQGQGPAGIGRRFQPHPLLQSDAVLSLDEDCLLTTDEVDFAFAVWQAFPDRIVGYPARSHYWDDAKGTWGYTSKWTNDYSIVLTGAAFYHRYYNYLYTYWLSPLLHKTVEQSQNCEDILMNFLVSHVTRRPPIKVTQRKQYKEQPPGGARYFSRSPWNDPDHFIQRQTCLNTFAAVFGYMPLLRSNMRLDPVLFKDPVSNMRKKYRQIELVGS
ncbi:exostosin-1 isoform X1 [Schistocerca gregaria]|uniref:exostosin-1 isoform X1 n=1 Tax=Schistocerca gregaria TaxID=7010 RepID=UPI00211DB4CE|nr:exostosin-1 isoform X1 [Schistocerca gregaria]